MRFTAWLVLAATLLLWSGNWIVARAVRNDISPGIATAGRLVVVLLILLPFTWRNLLAKAKTLQGIPVLLAIGLFGGGLHLAFQWLGLHYTTATSATLYLSTAPIFILLLARPMLGERIAPRQWIGVAVSFAGVALIGTQGRLFTGLQQLTFNVRRRARAPVDGVLGRLHGAAAHAARRARHAGIPDGPLRDGPAHPAPLGGMGAAPRRKGRTFRRRHARRPLFRGRLAAARGLGLDLRGQAHRRRARRGDHAPHARHRRAPVDALPRRIPGVVSRRGHRADPRGRGAFILG